MLRNINTEVSKVRVHNFYQVCFWVKKFWNSFLENYESSMMGNTLLKDHLCDLMLLWSIHFYGICHGWVFYVKWGGLYSYHCFNGLRQGWPNLLNVKASYDKLQMFESCKTWTNITHTFLLLHAHVVTKILKYIYSPWTLNLRFNSVNSQFVPGK
jgi:hypothetical protein